MEATSAMMMAVEQFVVGHHEQIKECHAQIQQYERNLDSMVEQKMHLTRVLGIYGEIQEDATRAIQMLGSAPTQGKTSLRELNPRTRFRVAAIVVIACTAMLPAPTVDESNTQ